MTDKETTFDDYLKEQLKDPEFRKEWEKLRDEDAVMNNDLISRSELKKVINDFYDSHFIGAVPNELITYANAVDTAIDITPTVDLWQLQQKATENALKKAEVLYGRPQGEWYYNCQNGWHCSLCHKAVKFMPTIMGKANFDFCPNCGADMRGKHE